MLNEPTARARSLEEVVLARGSKLGARSERFITSFPDGKSTFPWKCLRKNLVQLVFT